jgi:hypothetical protein
MTNFAELSVDGPGRLCHVEARAPSIRWSRSMAMRCHGTFDGSEVVCQKTAASLFPKSRVRDVAGFIQARGRGGLYSTRCNGKIGRCNGRKTRYYKRDYSDVSINGSSSVICKITGE